MKRILVVFIFLFKIRTISVVIFLFACFANTSWAQVGINNPNPHTKSILDVWATDKGLLIPRVTKAIRESMFSAAPNGDISAEGMLVFQTDDAQGFYYYGNQTWYSLNEWVKVAGSNDVLLNGNAIVIGSLSTGSISNSGGITTNAISVISSISSASITNSGAVSTGSISSAGNISGRSLSVSGFSSNALVPTGGIIMWSGPIASIPSGWALCNGANGTPDLRDRFIVGAGNSYSVANTGGQNTVTLTINQLPSHTHLTHGSGTISGSLGQLYLSRSSGRYSGGGTDTFGGATAPDPSLLTGSTGSDQAHENRPPYYALAYIMKL